MDKGYADTPSNRLYHGEVSDFFAACRDMIAQARQEARWIRTTYAKVDPEDATKGLAAIDSAIAAVEACRADYTAALAQMEAALSERWTASTDDTIVALGEALSSGDYSRLAL